MNWLKSVLVLGVLQVAVAGSCNAAALDAIKAQGVLRVGTEGTYAPFTFHDASGTLTGFDVEIARAVADRLGVKAEFLEGKWDGLIAGLDAKRYDAVVNEVWITDARKAKYDFSEPYIVSKAALIARSDNSSIKGFADLKGKKSAQTLTSNFGKLAEKSRRGTGRNRRLRPIHRPCASAPRRCHHQRQPVLPRFQDPQAGRAGQDCGSQG